MRIAASLLFAAFVVSSPVVADEMQQQLDSIKATLETMQKLTREEQRQEFPNLLLQTNSFLDTYADKADEASLVLVSNLTFQLLEITEDYAGLEKRLGQLKGLPNAKGKLLKLIEHYEGKLRIRPGAVAPDFTAIDVHSKEELKLSNLRGKLVLVDFWATWCGPCLKLMENELKPIFEKYGDDERFKLVGLGMAWQGETVEKQAELSEAKGYRWTKVFDSTGDAGKAYGINGIPFLVLVDEEGKILVADSGWKVIAKVKEILAERLKKK